MGNLQVKKTGGKPVECAWEVYILSRGLHLVTDLKHLQNWLKLLVVWSTELQRLGMCGCQAGSFIGESKSKRAVSLSLHDTRYIDYFPVLSASQPTLIGWSGHLGDEDEPIDRTAWEQVYARIGSLLHVHNQKVRLGSGRIYIRGHSHRQYLQHLKEVCPVCQIAGIMQSVHLFDIAEYLAVRDLRMGPMVGRSHVQDFQSSVPWSIEMSR